MKVDEIEAVLANFFRELFGSIWNEAAPEMGESFLTCVNGLARNLKGFSGLPDPHTRNRFFFSVVVLSAEVMIQVGESVADFACSKHDGTCLRRIDSKGRRGKRKTPFQLRL